MYLQVYTYYSILYWHTRPLQVAGKVWQHLLPSHLIAAELTLSKALGLTSTMEPMELSKKGLEQDGPLKKNMHNLAWKMTVQTNWNLEDDLLEINRARKMGLEMGQENDVVPIVPFEHVFLLDFRRLWFCVFHLSFHREKWMQSWKILGKKCYLAILMPSFWEKNGQWLADWESMRIHESMDWFRGKFTGKPHISW